MSARIVSAFLMIGFLGTAVAAKGQAPQRRAPRVTLGVMIDESRQTPDQKGVVVRDVDPAGPAAKAGLKPGDVIVKIDDKDVANFDGLRKALTDHKAGDKLSVTVMGDGKEKKLTVALAARRPRPAVGGGGSPREGGQAFLGILTQPLTPETKSQFNTDANEGVVVTQVGPGTPASKAGIRGGDVITKVDGKAITNPEELRDAVRAARPGQDLTISVARGGKSQEIKVRPEEASGDLRFGLPPLPQGGLGRPSFEGLPTFGEDRQTIQRLEQRIQELEKRVRELENKRGESPK